MPQNKIIEVDSVGSFYICRADIFSKYKITYSTKENDVKPEQNNYRKYESEQVCFCNDVKSNTNYKICINYNVSVDHVNLEKYGLKGKEQEFYQLVEHIQFGKIEKLEL